MWWLYLDESGDLGFDFVNKRKVFDRLASDKGRVYNYVSRLVIDQIPFDQARGQVQLVIDRSKGARAIREYNQYLTRQLEGRISPEVSLDIRHDDSRQWPGLQWADLFAWGLFQKHERGNREWYNVFSDKVRYEQRFL